MISARAKLFSQRNLDEERAKFAGINVHYTKISDAVDYLYEFKYMEVFWDYMNHRTKRLSFHTISAILIFLVLYVIPSEVTALIGDIDSGESSHYFVARLSCSLAMVPICILLLISGSAMLWIKITHARKFGSTVFSETIPEGSRNVSTLPYWCSMAFSFLCSLLFNLKFIRRSLSFSCISSDAIFGIGDNKSSATFCYEEGNLDIAVSMEATFMFFSLLINFVSISNVSVKLVWFNFFLGVATVIFIGYYLQVLLLVTYRAGFVALFVATAIADLQYSGILDYLYSQEVIRLHEKLNSVQEETEKLFKEEMRALIGNVAHDIKSPLTSFITAIEYFETLLFEMSSLFDKSTANTKIATENKQYNNIPILRTRITDMQTCLQSLRSTYEVSLTIINRSSDFYRSAVGAPLIPNKDMINVKQLVFDSIKCMEAMMFSRSKIRLEWNANASEAIGQDIISDYEGPQLGNKHHWIPDFTLYLHTDGQWLRENLLCLISNAVKFSNEAEVVLSVDMITEEVVADETIGKPSLTFVRFGVVDKGLFMTDEELSEFFRFNSISKTRFTGGIGLGLVTLAKRVDALKGRYGANRRRDEKCGTEVWFMIPYQEMRSYSIVANVEEHVQPAGTGSAVNKSSFTTLLPLNTSITSDVFSGGIVTKPNSPKHILIVDDSAAIVKMLSMMLKKLGYLVSTAMHGKAAVESVMTSFLNEEDQDEQGDRERKQSIDIIMMDIQMPVMNGLEAMKCIRQWEDEQRGHQGTMMTESTVSQTIHTVASEDGELLLQPPIIVVQKRQGIPPICIIAMSANSEFSTYQDAVNAGADAFLNKPFTMELFEQTLAKCQRKQGHH